METLRPESWDIQNYFNKEDDIVALKAAIKRMELKRKELCS